MRFTRRLASQALVVSSVTGPSLSSTALATALFTSTVNPPSARTAASTSESQAASSREVGRYEHGVATALDGFSDDRVPARPVPSVHHDVRALGRESQRDGPTDSGRGPGDECPCSLESRH